MSRTAPHPESGWVLPDSYAAEDTHLRVTHTHTHCCGLSFNPVEFVFIVAAFSPKQPNKRFNHTSGSGSQWEQLWISECVLLAVV